MKDTYPRPSLSSGNLTPLNKETEKPQWGNPLQNPGCYIQLVELITDQRNQKNSSVGEPLEKFRLLPSVGGSVNILRSGGIPCKHLLPASDH